MSNINHLARVMDSFITINFEFFGTTRILSGRKKLALKVLCDGIACWSLISIALLQELPQFSGKIIDVDNGKLLSSYTLNRDGKCFINYASADFFDNDTILIVPSMSGG